MCYLSPFFIHCDHNRSHLKEINRFSSHLISNITSISSGIKSRIIIIIIIVRLSDVVVLSTFMSVFDLRLSQILEQGEVVII